MHLNSCQAAQSRAFLFFPDTVTEDEAEDWHYCINQALRGGLSPVFIPLGGPAVRHGIMRVSFICAGSFYVLSSPVPLHACRSRFHRWWHPAGLCLRYLALSVYSWQPQQSAARFAFNRPPATGFCPAAHCLAAVAAYHTHPGRYPSHDMDDGRAGAIGALGHHGLFLARFSPSAG